MPVAHDKISVESHGASNKIEPDAPSITPSVDCQGATTENKIPEPHARSDIRNLGTMLYTLGFAFSGLLELIMVYFVFQNHNRCRICRVIRFTCCASTHIPCKVLINFYEHSSPLDFFLASLTFTIMLLVQIDIFFPLFLLYFGKQFSTQGPWHSVLAYDACVRLCLNAWARGCMEAPVFLENECALLRSAFG